MPGFAAGVMIAASFWSLLAPAIALPEEVNGIPPWIPAAVGFILGGGSLWILNKYLPHMHPSLAVGVAFGAASLDVEEATLGSPIALVTGIGLQNFPEGASVSVTLRREGYSRKKSLIYPEHSL